jgi:sugar phosphate isomerase/epimerase
MQPLRSHHLIGLVRGQFGEIPEHEWLDFLVAAGFDGWEEASWELDLSSCDTAAGAEAYATRRLGLARDRGLAILSVATHLHGQALGDEPSAKTLPFVGGEAVDAYVAWRRSGHEPPRTDPYHVPAEVGRLIHSQAQRGLVRAARLAGALGRLQGRRVPLPGFVGSPAQCWSHWFEFPPRPSEIGGCSIPDVLDASLEILVERFAPVFDACRESGTTFDLECHPSERAMGDIESAGDYIRFLEQAGYGSDVVGFNLDPSHMVWQGVSPIDFIRAYAPWIHAAHIKGVQVVRAPTRAGLLGGHRPMGSRHNGWNFVTAGSGRDSVPLEEVIVELNRAGYSGALAIEWEDNDAEKRAGAVAALAAVRAADLPPATGRHDDALRATRRDAGAGAS